MSGSVTGSSSRAYSLIEEQLPTVTSKTQSSSIHGIDSEESTGETGKEQVSNMVGWTVYKKYGMNAVKGVLEGYNSETKIYDVRYKDGKCEKVTEENVLRYLSPCRPENEQPRGSALRINAQNAGPIRSARKAGKRTRAGTAPAQQSRQVSGGSAADELPTADSGNGGKKRYRSLRMNPGR